MRSTTANNRARLTSTSCQRRPALRCPLAPPSWRSRASQPDVLPVLAAQHCRAGPPAAKHNSSPVRIDPFAPLVRSSARVISRYARAGSSAPRVAASRTLTLRGPPESRTVAHSARAAAVSSISSSGTGGTRSAPKFRNRGREPPVTEAATSCRSAHARLVNGSADAPHVVRAPPTGDDDVWVVTSAFRGMRGKQLKPRGQGELFQHRVRP